MLSADLYALQLELECKHILSSGRLARFPCDTVFGMHNHPGMPVGTFAIRPGTMMAGGAFFDIHVEGRGSHGARPEQSIDSVLVASHIVTALQAIVARNVSALDSAVVSVTTIRSGDAYNVIPQTAEIRGTVRTFRNDTMDLVADNMKRIAEGVGAAFGATVRVAGSPSDGVRPGCPHSLGQLFVSRALRERAERDRVGQLGHRGRVAERDQLGKPGFQAQ